METHAEALGWLLEMEVIDNPYVLNSIILNSFKNIKGLKDIQLLIDKPKKRVLVYLELKYLYKIFKENSIIQHTEEMLQQVLPSYRFRIITDLALFNKAQTRLAEDHDRPH